MATTDGRARAITETKSGSPTVAETVLVEMGGAVKAGLMGGGVWLGVGTRVPLLGVLNSNEGKTHPDEKTSPIIKANKRKE